MAATKELREHLLSSDSELSEVDTVSLNGLDEFEARQPHVPGKGALILKFKRKAPITGSGTTPGAEEVNRTMDVDNNDDRELDDGRSNKRMKGNDGVHKAVASVPGHSFNINTHDNQLKTPPSSPIVTTINTSSNPNTSTTNPTKPLPRQRLKMTIVPKTEYDNLRSQNNILRSHNLSLAKQNANLRNEHSNALWLYEEVQGTPPLDHDNCVRKDDYLKLQTTNTDLANTNAKLQYERQLMHECGLEWARREHMWEVEKQLLKNEVTDLVVKVEDMEKREQNLVVLVREVEARTQRAERVAEQERVRVVGLQEFIRQAQAQAAIAGGTSASRGGEVRGLSQQSAYPPL